MPRYEYECPFGHRQETIKSINDYGTEELCHHPVGDTECGEPMAHVFRGEGVIFVNHGGGAGTRTW